MKTLYLIRHAKSSWAFNLPDHDRPLGPRGRKDVRKMGKYLAKEYRKPELLLSSTASRAFYTALHMCDAFGLDEENILLEPKLYHASAEQILNTIQKSKDCSCLAVFGHNPSFTYTANLFCNTDIENIPTCGVVGVSFDVKTWAEVTFGSGELLFFHFPKELS